MILRILKDSEGFYYINSNRFATPGGRRGLQACGLWMRSVFFVRTTVPMLNINEKTASDLADTADRADATDITVFCYIVFFLVFFVGCGGRRHAHNINATRLIFQIIFYDFRISSLQ